MSQKNMMLIVLGCLYGCPAWGQELKYEKYKLDNGMTVILHEDHSLPVAAVNLWYKVGSKDEPQRRSGFAHLFEHLMFMGTQRVPGNKFDTIMESGGGSNNASTSSDRTNYYSSGPSNLLPTLLWLEADRLEDLARTMNQEKLDKQRDVVRNERRQQYENRPYGKADLLIQEAMFPPGHPYHIPVIGTHEDLEAATVSDVKDFFATFYVPANVTLAVAGDFDPARTKTLINELFGNLPDGGTPQRRSAGPVRLETLKRMTMIDKVQLPMVSFVYHSPPWYAEGDAEMDLLAAILTRGKTSRLYKRLIYDDKIAAEVAAYQDSSQLGSLFRIDVLANPGVDLERIEKTVDEELSRLVREGPGAEELEKYKVAYELNMLSGLQTVEAKADQLNEYDYIWGEPNSFKRDLDRYRNATVAGVRQWAGSVLTPEARLIARVLPEEPQRISSARDAQPELADPANFDPPMPDQFKLRNGIPVMVWTKKDLPLVAMSVVFLRTGYMVGDSNRPGAIWITADMLDEGTADLDALKFNDAMQELGARFQTYAERDAILVSLTVLKRNFPRAAELAVDSFRRNRLDYDDFERVRKLHLEDLRQQEDEPAVVAARVAAAAFFGSEHRYGWPIEGTLDSIAKMTYDDLKVQYATMIRPDFVTVLVAGDITRAEAQSLLDPMLGTWQLPSVSNPEKQGIKMPKRQDLEVFLVDRPGAVQTVIHFIMPGPSYGDSRRTQYWLLNTLLGGSFTSRLNMNLREQHGYTYGARSAFNMRHELGALVASSSVRADATGEAIREFITEFQKLSTGDVSDDDALKARETLRTDIIQAFAGLGGMIRQGFERTVNRQPIDTLASDLRTLGSVSASQLNELARSAIPLSKGVLVLVGDKATVLNEYQELQPVGPTKEGMRIALPPPIEVDSMGNRIKS